MDPGLFFLIVLGVVLATVAAFGIRIVPPDMVGNVVTLGRRGRNVHPGPHWIFPFVQELRMIDRRAQTLNPPMEPVLAKDGIPVRPDLLEIYQVDNAGNALFNVAEPGVVLLGFTREALAASIPQFTSIELIETPSARDTVEQAIRTALGPNLGWMGVMVRKVAIERFRAPKEVEEARTGIEIARLNRQELVTRAQAEADVVGIERVAEQGDWVPKSAIDAFEKVGMGIVNALVAAFAKKEEKT